jgi:hypothetical protein
LFGNSPEAIIEFFTLNWPARFAAANIFFSKRLLSEPGRHLRMRVVKGIEIVVKLSEKATSLWLG